ncbi:hypothetical protein BZA05DRAFT_454871 [Tricharina praecox]|uniref:uncharacterized protein n=1 Tax=Tricharina praecox TaxID=43433 RepID=UPI0022205E32|nr:uncharacterized protein BZA05DRAFT_454871 [Tricharina praecox]KAI5849018.1 hypothetical protein BZA05DRAFT_454871 [Tricharina praecox]
MTSSVLYMGGEYTPNTTAPCLTLSWTDCGVRSAEIPGVSGVSRVDLLHAFGVEAAQSQDEATTGTRERESRSVLRVINSQRKEASKVGIRSRRCLSVCVLLCHRCGGGGGAAKCGDVCCKLQVAILVPLRLVAGAHPPDSKVAYLRSTDADTDADGGFVVRILHTIALLINPFLQLRRLHDVGKKQKTRTVWPPTVTRQLVRRRYVSSPRIQNPESRIQNPESRIQNPEIYWHAYGNWLQPPRGNY